MIRKTLFGCGLLLASSVALAAGADLVISSSNSADATTIDLDLLNDANVSALQFELAIPAGTVDTGDCLSALPATHTGACKFTNGVLRVAIFGTGNDALPSGALGSITVDGNVDQSSLDVSNLLMGTGDAFEVKGEAIMHRVKAGSDNRRQVERTDRHLQ